MSPNLLNTLILALVFLALFTSAELLYYKFNIEAEFTRKYVHISTGLLTMLFPPLIGNHWLILALCASFLLILVASKILKMLPSINAVDRVTRGSFLYPVIVYSCYLIYNQQGQYMFYYIPILVLALADPVAALLGKKYCWKPYTVLGQTKTFCGSIGFFVVAFITCMALLISLEEMSLSHALIISFSVSIVTVFAEAYTLNGWDNLSIPASAVVTLLIINTYL